MLHDSNFSTELPDNLAVFFLFYPILNITIKNICIFNMQISFQKSIMRASYFQSHQKNYLVSKLNIYNAKSKLSLQTEVLKISYIYSCTLPIFSLITSSKCFTSPHTG